MPRRGPLKDWRLWRIFPVLAALAALVSTVAYASTTVDASAHRSAATTYAYDRGAPTVIGDVADVVVSASREDAARARPSSADLLGVAHRSDFVVAANSGDTLFSAGGGSARLPMNMGTVRSVASRYGIQIDDLSININKSRAGIRGSTAPNGCVTLCRGAFESEEQLAKTLVHERVHVEDLRGGMPYPRTYDAASAAELRAEEIARAWWESFR